MANENMHMSSTGYAALRNSEGVRMRYYNDAPVNGNCTWGAGTLAHYGPCTAEELRRPVTAQQVDSELHQRVQEAERLVRRSVNRTPLTQAQFDAAVSFTYNSTTFNSRWVLEPANAGNMGEVANRMRQSVMVYQHDNHGRRVGHGHVNTGLVHRREREVQPFLGQPR